MANLRLLASVAAASAAASAAALTPVSAGSSTFHISNVFGSHMTLQRNKPIPIWGWGDAGAGVNVVFNGQKYSTPIDKTGFWKVVLPAMQASFTPATITATQNTTGASQTLEDVLIGDVVLCSGQSNMEFTVNAAANASAEIQAANLYPHIRITSGPLQGAFNLNNVSAGPYKELAVIDLPWSVANNVTVGCPGCQGWNYFSAACWFTIRSISDELSARGELVPLGAIAQTYGGTSIQWWSSAEAIGSCDTPPGSACCSYGGSNSCLYDSQIAPYTLGPTALSGYLYYQGEQNGLFLLNH
jgi:sialate O-acetylesterase